MNKQLKDYSKKTRIIKICSHIFCYSLIMLTAGTSVFGEETPVSLSATSSSVDVKKGRRWRSPNYSGQSNTLGYSKSPFYVSVAIAKRVKFWKDIYTKYTGQQGLLHDSRFIDILYEEVDFKSIINNASLNQYQQQRAKKKFIKKRKKKIQKMLVALSKHKSAKGLVGEELRIWRLFASKGVKPSELRAAARKGRLRFQLGQRDQLIRGIFLSGRYLERMEKIFQEAGLPKELTRLPFVESSFNDRARSKVGASGIWQFMRGSARPYLKMNFSVDERNDPLSATVAAAKLLKSNFKSLGSWPLALTAYNHGPAGVRRLLRKFNATTLDEVLEERYRRFGFASSNFYATFLAVLEVERTAEASFGQLTWDFPVGGSQLRLKRSIRAKQLIDWFDKDRGLAKRMNPHLKSHVWKGWRVISKGNFVRIPEAKRNNIVAQMRQMKDQSPNFNGVRKYSIARGDTLSEIAMNHGIGLRALKRINGIRNSSRIRAGQKLIIPKLR